MKERLTWEEIKSKYPDQWVSIIEPEATENGVFKSGIVTAANKDKKSVIVEFKKQMKKGIEFNIHTFRFTGKIPSIVGLYRLEIQDV